MYWHFIFTSVKYEQEQLDVLRGTRFSRPIKPIVDRVSREVLYCPSHDVTGWTKVAWKLSYSTCLKHQYRMCTLRKRENGQVFASANHLKRREQEWFPNIGLAISYFSQSLRGSHACSHSVKCISVPAREHCGGSFTFNAVAVWFVGTGLADPPHVMFHHLMGNSTQMLD